MPPNMRSDRSFEYLPRAVRALRFHGPEPLGVADWPALLEQTDRARLTLALGIRCREWLPADVRGRIERDLTNNAERYRRFADVRGQIADALMPRATSNSYSSKATRISPISVAIFCTGRSTISTSTVPLPSLPKPAVSLKS